MIDIMQPPGYIADPPQKTFRYPIRRSEGTVSFFRYLRQLLGEVKTVSGPGKSGHQHIVDRFNKRYPAGHYYSPLPDWGYIQANWTKLFDRSRQDIPGITLRIEEQVKILVDLRDNYAKKIPYEPTDESDTHRWYNFNNFYSNKDAAIYCCMLMRFAPNQVIEIGSGYSSAVALDINELRLNRKVAFTFIEPYQDRLNTLISDRDKSSTTIIRSPLQEVDLHLFDQLEENDILFIDSSHVSKIGSDVNLYLFQILPRLKKGVLIHFHDVFHPFEYLEAWYKEGRAWNEAYLLRAFLQYNNTFQIELFTSYLWDFHKEAFGDHWLFSSPHGSRSSLWLRKIR